MQQQPSTTDDNANDATLPRIDAMLDAMPEATDEQIARMIEVETDFEEFFKIRDGANALGLHIESTRQLASKVGWRRLRRDLEKTLGRKLEPSLGPFDGRECARLLQKAMGQLVEADREMRKLKAVAELRAFFTGRADLPKAATAA